MRELIENVVAAGRDPNFANRIAAGNFGGGVVHYFELALEPHR